MGRYITEEPMPTIASLEDLKAALKEGLGICAMPYAMQGDLLLEL